MISFPNAKINIGLNITSRRPDGYHNIESCFYPIEWTDVLEIIPSEQLKFTTSGLSIPGSSDNNLCLKAYHLLKEKYNISDVHIHLHKVIPMGAGLGGGSANGAFTLKMLNDLFELNLSDQQLEDYAGKLGSDCPFFIKNKPVTVRGTGNIFSDAPVSLTGKHLLIKNPSIHISTQEAYANVTPAEPSSTLDSILTQPITNWKAQVKNDFEKSVFPNHPEISTLKDSLYQLGAIYASMTGSGSTVYGIFDKEIKQEGFHCFKL